MFVDYLYDEKCFPEFVLCHHEFEGLFDFPLYIVCSTYAVFCLSTSFIRQLNLSAEPILKCTASQSLIVMYILVNIF